MKDKNMKCPLCSEPQHRDADKMLVRCPNVVLERESQPVYLKVLGELYQ